MGNACNNIEQLVPIVDSPDLVFTKFASKPDAFMRLFEHEINLFRLFEFNDFLNNLINFQESELVRQDSKSIEQFVVENLTDNDWQQFLAKKIVDHSIYKESGNANENASALFVLYYTRLFFEMIKGQAAYRRFEGQGAQRLVNKRYIGAFGILYCPGRNADKIRYVFDMYSQDGKLKKNNEDLDNFIFYLIFLATMGPVLAIRSLEGSIPSEYLPKLDQETFAKVFEDYRTENFIMLTQGALNGLFKEKEEVTYEEFEKASVENNWLYQLAGIRSILDASFTPEVVPEVVAEE